MPRTSSQQAQPSQFALHQPDTPASPSETSTTPTACGETAPTTSGLQTPSPMSQTTASSTSTPESCTATVRLVICAMVTTPARWPSTTSTSVLQTHAEMEHAWITTTASPATVAPTLPVQCATPVSQAQLASIVVRRLTCACQIYVSMVLTVPS